MKRVMLGLTLAFTLLSSTGCELLQRRNCNNCNGAIGCRPCRIGWQRGGTDYQRLLSHNGAYGHGGGVGHGGGIGQGGALGHGAAYGYAAPAGSGGVGGAPAAQVAYPYYTTRGPRDFLLDNPPTIGR